MVIFHSYVSLPEGMSVSGNTPSLWLAEVDGAIHFDCRRTNTGNQRKADGDVFMLSDVE